MKKIFYLFLTILLLASCQIAEAQKVADFEDSGKFKLIVSDAEIGSLNYTLSKEGNYSRSFTLAMSGQKASFYIDIEPDKLGNWDRFRITAPTDTVLVENLDSVAEYSSKGKKYSTKLQTDYILYDNYGPVFESMMLKKYDMKIGGIQKIKRFIMPTTFMDFEIEYVGEELRDVSGKELRLQRFDAKLMGMTIEMWAGEDYKLYMLNVPKQFAVYIREGYEDLLKFRKEDPLVSKPSYEVKNEKVMVPMRDGVKLATDLYMPQSDGKKFPVVLIRTPYKKEMMEMDGYFFSKRGYIVAVQDCRGRFGSEGVWEPFVNEAKDGYDAIEWLAAQPYSNGKTGMIGGSYQGWTQLWAAVEKPPHLTTIIPQVAPPDPFFNIPYEYGAFFILGSVWWAQVLESEATADISGAAMAKLGDSKYEELLKKLPVIDLDTIVFGKENKYWRKWIQNNVNNEYWAKSNFMHKLPELDIPVFMMSGWFDGDGIGSKLNYMQLKKSKNKNIKLIIGPWGHTSRSSQFVGDKDMGEQAGIDLQTLYLKWFDFWLKGVDNKILEEPLVKLYDMYSNKWRNGAEYPLPETKFKKLYLTSACCANTSKGNGKLVWSIPDTGGKFDKYIYNPEDPTPDPEYTFSDTSESDNKAKKGEDLEELKNKLKKQHNSVTDERGDILVYQTEPLAEPVSVVGPVSAKLYASSSAVDTDWFVSMMEVDTAGEIFPLCTGVMRARFRNSTSKPEMMTPGKVYEFDIDIWQTGITFRKGCRIRVEISSCRFPIFSRNLNTGGHNEMDTKFIRAENRIYHTKEYPSHILLPVIE